MVLGVGAALENIVPPVPADTFVLFGAFLAATGRADPRLVFVTTWLPNVASAILVYALSRRFGARLFATRPGRMLLHPRQMARIHGFYRRWGVAAIFVSRFLPGFRAVVPVFAGVSGVGVWRVSLPILGASGLWYGTLVYFGTLAGHNWAAIAALFVRYNRLLLWAALGLALLLAAWWARTRRSPDE